MNLVTDRLNLVKLLVENGASISEVNNLKQTPLILAAINGSLDFEHFKIEWIRSRFNEKDFFLFFSSSCHFGIPS